MICILSCWPGQIFKCLCWRLLGCGCCDSDTPTYRAIITTLPWLTLLHHLFLKFCKKICGIAGIVKHYFVFGTLSIFLGCSFHVCSFIIDYCLSFETPQQTRTILINYFPNIYDQNHLHLQPCVHSGDGSWGYITILQTTIREIRSQHRRLCCQNNSMPILGVSQLAVSPKKIRSE